jgi:hypothetical protein
MTIQQALGDLFANKQCVDAGALMRKNSSGIVMLAMCVHCVEQYQPEGLPAPASP